MRTIAAVLLGAIGLAWTITTQADSSISPLDNDKIEIRSILDPNVTIPKTQPISILLPQNATIADKQLLQLIRNNLIADGFTVTSPDKSDWTLYATERDQSQWMTYTKPGLFVPSTESATVSYATITLVICSNSDLTVPIWTSTVFTLNDYWINNQEKIVKAILATYGANFYVRNEDPKDVPDDMTKAKYQPAIPTLEQLKHCVANPKADGC